jgi:glucan phosphorylase
MKAALNGVPASASSTAGGLKNGTKASPGWAISDHDDEVHEANSLYDRLEQVILPLYYGQPDGWRRIMWSTIAINGPYFNTQRMLKQYVLKAYFPQLRPAATPMLEQVLRTSVGAESPAANWRQFRFGIVTATELSRLFGNYNNFDTSGGYDVL